VTAPEAPWRPTRREVAAAVGRTVPDVVAPGLRVLFCGINPGLYSGAVGHHFARPGNRFWKALHLAGFTDRVLTPFEERDLLAAGLGITNLVRRATATADKLSDDELRDGGVALARKVRRFRPEVVAFLGIGAYRVAFGRGEATIGPQPDTVGGVPAWVLPNPSGLNAHYQLEDLATEFRALRERPPAAGLIPRGPRGTSANGPRRVEPRRAARPGTSSPPRAPR
jgi:TDG/mug DNA glycosylase family protein